MRGDQRVALAVARVDGEHFLEPAVRAVGAIGEQIGGGVNRHGVEGFRRELQRGVGGFERGLVVGILQREIGEQLVRFDVIGIDLDGLVDVFARLVIEAVGADLREADIRVSVFRIALQRFFEQFGRLDVVEALVQQQSPADAIMRVLLVTRDGGAERRVRVFVLLEAPKSFGARIGVRPACERLIAGGRFRALAVMT